MTLPAEGERISLCSRDELRQTASALAGMRVTLMGLGLFGGGVGAARFLAGRGADLLVTDLRPPRRLAPSLAALEGLPISYRLGEHVEDDLTGADLVIANPAVPRASPYLRAARRAGVPVASPMNLFLTLCPARVAAVTGSNGKSTTTALLAAMLEPTGRTVWLGGNIGVSLLPSLDRMAVQDFVVLELSSFQLQDAEALAWSPHVAVVTNLTPNHLDRHLDFREYEGAKQVIWRFQGEDDFLVLNAGDPVLCDWVRRGVPSRLLFFGSAPEGGELHVGMNAVGECLVWWDGRRAEVVCRRRDVPLLGRHNAQNAMAAAAAARPLGAAPEDVRAGLADFRGLEHRLEFVAEFDGLAFYNDSNSTTPISSVAAIETFGRPVTLIAGGYDKKLDPAPLARSAAQRARALITLGQTGPRLAARTRGEALRAGRPVIVREARTLQEALALAMDLSAPGSVVVLSPGCASYDMFENFDQRGRAFKDLVLLEARLRRARAKSA